MNDYKSSPEIIVPSLTHLREEHENPIANVLTKNLSGHKDANDGFTLLPPDVDQYPFQRLDCVGMNGKNAGPEELRALASVVYPDTERVVDSFAKRRDLLNHAAFLLLNGKEIGFVADHFQSVIGIAVGGGSFVCALYENTPVTPEDIDVNIFVSYFIKYTKLQGFVPTPQVLSEIFTQTTYTLPPSPSIRDEIPSEVRQPVNNASQEKFIKNRSINKEGALRGRLNIFAGSGHRDVTIPAHLENGHPVPKTTHMGPMAFGTSDIIKSMPTLPVGIDLSSRKPKVFIGELPPKPASHDFEADAVMQEIAEGMSTPTHRRKYHTARESFKQVSDQAKAHS